MESEKENHPHAEHSEHEIKKHETAKHSDHIDHSQKKTKKQHKAEKSKKRNFTPYIIGALVALIVLVFILKAVFQKTPSVIQDPSKYGSVDVEFYVMSQCPYGTQVEDAFQPVIAEFGKNIDFELNFIGAETATGFSSLHGAPEVEGDIIQLCVQDLYKDKLMDFVVCQNKDAANLKASVEKCAEESSIDPAKIKECAESGKGKALLSESIKKSQQANARGSPTMYFNNQLYSGARDADSFKRTVCAGLNNHPLCEGIPKCSINNDCREEAGKVGICENPGKKDARCVYVEDEKIKLTIVNAEECSSCDSTQLAGMLKQIFINTELEQVDASSAEGQSLIKELNLKHAPSYVFSGNLENTYAWKENEQLRAAFREVGETHVLIDEATGATYLLDGQERKKQQELVGIKLGDNKPQIDFYVMSYCPYGNLAEEAIEPVYQLLKSKAEFNPHYVIYSNYNGGGSKFCRDSESNYCSMHGIQELNQDIRELCVNNKLGIKAYFAFVLEMNKACNYQNADSCWKGVAEDLGFDTQAIADCEENEWESILSKELELNKALGVSGSPTVYIEGSAYSGSRTPAGFAQALCAGFDTKPTECSSEKLASLSSDSSAAANAGNC